MQRPFIVTLDVTNDKLDKVYQHLHHARILELLEDARLQFLKAIGFASEDLIAKGLFPVISSINIKYLREVRAGKVQVTCEDRRVVWRGLLINQRMILPNGKLLVEAEVVSMLLSSSTKRAVSIENPLKDAFLLGV